MLSKFKNLNWNFLWCCKFILSRFFTIWRKSGFESFEEEKEWNNCLPLFTSTDLMIHWDKILPLFLFLGRRSCIGFQEKWRSNMNMIILRLKIFKVWYQTPICWGDIWRWFEFSLCKYLGVLLLLLQWHFICSFQIPSSFCSWYCQEIYVKYMSECNDYIVSVELCV